MSLHAETRPRKSHVWAPVDGDFYIEPAWCSERLFAVETFRGPIHDPCCGSGTIVEAAHRAGLVASGSDLVDRGYRRGRHGFDFLTSTGPLRNVVCNPPFSVVCEFALHALSLLSRKGSKLAILFPVARLNAAHHWITGTPLRRVWLLTPRPSMPPGHVIAAGEKPGGGRVDFCWMVFERGHDGAPELDWLHRDDLTESDR